VLRSVADRLTRTARSVDTVGRLGGNEFAVVLESTGGPGATAALGRLRDSLADGWAEVVGGESAVAAVSVSLGMATYRPGDGVASLLARADAETYADPARRSAGA
jgi:diguanylate cyclase (GGDEF)-like protein